MTYALRPSDVLAWSLRKNVCRRVTRQSEIKEKRSENEREMYLYICFILCLFSSLVPNSRSSITDGAAGSTNAEGSSLTFVLNSLSSCIVAQHRVGIVRDALPIHTTSDKRVWT